MVLNTCKGKAHLARYRYVISLLEFCSACEGLRAFDNEQMMMSWYQGDQHLDQADD